MPEIRAPFTDDQVETLNRFQVGGWFHPFTCGRRAEHPDNEGVLVASNDGWHCPVCDYTQDWAHWFMADRDCVAGNEARHRQRWSWFQETS